jgi:N-sulfoglucosamine sulfohydrolase
MLRAWARPVHLPVVGVLCRRDNAGLLMNLRLHTSMLTLTKRTAFALGCWLALSLHAADRPNVILVIGDDISWDDFGCYGNPTARTPNIDRLAAQGLRFTNAFLTASSCSPSRSSIVTGRYPHNIGAASELHRPIAWNVPRFPALLREKGYFTLLSGKNHMSQEKPPAGQTPQPEPFEVIDGGQGPKNRGGHANWVKHVQERPKERPFFFWFASHDAHRAWEADDEWNEAAYGPKHDPRKVRVPAFLVDDDATRRDLASYANEVTRLDHYVGRVVAELERQAILNDTLILVLADNGRPFPRAKTRLHDSGMKTALVAHWPGGIAKRPGSVSTALVSSIDLAPTILEIASVPIPESVQGRSLRPVLADPKARGRSFAFSEHNWHDYAAFGRAVRDGEYLFIVNLRPELPWQGPADSVRSPSHASLQSARKAGSLTTAQQDVFLAPRQAGELYRTADDPDQLKNLVGDPAHADALRRLREAMTRWIEETADSVPTDYSRDGFDRETGNRLFGNQDTSYYRTPAGSDRNAAQVNRPGPF